MLKGFNWIGALVALVLMEALGFLWYGPLFGDMWMKALGTTPDMSNATVNMVLGAVVTVIIIVGIDWLLRRLGALDLDGQLDHVVDAIGCHDEHAVVVGEHVVVLPHRDAVEHRGRHTATSRWHPPRTVRARAEAEHREPDLAQLRGVAVQAPDHHPGEPRPLGLEHHEVADARLVESAAVVDDHDRAGRRVVDRLEQHVDAAEMGHRTCGSGDRRGRTKRPEGHGGEPRLDTEAESGVGDGGGGRDGLDGHAAMLLSPPVAARPAPAARRRLPAIDLPTEKPYIARFSFATASP